MQQIEIPRHGEMTNAGVLFHDQTRGQDPGQTDASSGMNLEAKLPFQKNARRIFHGSSSEMSWINLFMLLFPTGDKARYIPPPFFLR